MSFCRLNHNFKLFNVLKDIIKAKYSFEVWYSWFNYTLFIYYNQHFENENYKFRNAYFWIQKAVYFINST